MHGTIWPYKEVVSSTISGWVKTVLKLAGVDVNIFKWHSTRAASTSKATVSGLSLFEILERSSWSSASTLQRFYKKDIIPTTAIFRIAFSLTIKSLLNRSCRFELRKEIWAPVNNSVLDRTVILWNKIMKLHKGAKRPQCNSDFMNKI